MKRRDWLSEESFTLLLGAGFFGFFAHAGCLAALEEAGLRPRRIVGVSAGALAGGLWASGLSAERLRLELMRLRRDDFWDPAFPLGGFLRGKKFSTMLDALLFEVGISRVEDCPMPFAAIAHDLLGGRTMVLDHGPIGLAIRASCTVPLLFRPVWNDGRLLVDGGVSDRSGFKAIGKGERVLFHHLPSTRRWPVRPTSPPGVPGADARMLVTPRLPRVTPFRLELGPVAFERARLHLRQWLDGDDSSPNVL